MLLFFVLQVISKSKTLFGCSRANIFPKLLVSW